jgi:hypothetical protein
MDILDMLNKPTQSLAPPNPPESALSESEADLTSQTEEAMPIIAAPEASDKAEPSDAESII